MSHMRFNSEDDDRVRELHSQGLTITQISKRLGKATNTVSRIHQKLGLSPHRKSPRLRSLPEFVGKLDQHHYGFKGKI